MERSQVPHAKRLCLLLSPQDLSETETTLVVPFAIEDATDSPPLTPPTPEILLLNQQVPQAPLNSVIVVTPSRPETPPAGGCLPHSRLPPITNLSADSKKLRQGELDELQQVSHYHHRHIYADIHCLSMNHNMHNN